MDQAREAPATPATSAPVRRRRDLRAPSNGRKPPHEIEVEITETRRRLGAAIEALDRELAPGRVIEHGAQALHRALEPRQGSVRDHAGAYAVPLALIAVGLGWLFIARRRHWRAELSAVSRETPADPPAAPASAELDTRDLDPKEAMAVGDTTVFFRVPQPAQ